MRRPRYGASWTPRPASQSSQPAVSRCTSRGSRSTRFRPSGCQTRADHADPERLAENEAVLLFIQRAANVRPGLRLTSDNAAAVAQIAVRLDGLPLAIELAASQAKLLDPRAILARLGRR